MKSWRDFTYPEFFWAKSKSYKTSYRDRLSRLRFLGLFALKNKRPQIYFLRSTGRFHNRLDSLPVNLAKPKVKVIAVGEHKSALEVENCYMPLISNHSKLGKVTSRAWEFKLLNILTASCLFYLVNLMLIVSYLLIFVYMEVNLYTKIRYF